MARARKIHLIPHDIQRAATLRAGPHDTPHPVMTGNDNAQAQGIEETYPFAVLFVHGNIIPLSHFLKHAISMTQIIAQDNLLQSVQNCAG